MSTMVVERVAGTAGSGAKERGRVAVAGFLDVVAFKFAAIVVQRKVGDFA
ncbi:MAG: hypothetical protein JRN58_00790 [Nitrososphaerota archaeon]|nr:hypothetical protein [Nitrososphaerota archaeon]MDG6977600.1 hypothetical protein [Nitrososphaerota archaeon]